MCHLFCLLSNRHWGGFGRSVKWERATACHPFYSLTNPWNEPSMGLPPRGRTLWHCTCLTDCGGEKRKRRSM